MNNSEINMMVFSICPSLRSGLLENHTELCVRVAKRIENTDSCFLDTSFASLRTTRK